MKAANDQLREIKKLRREESKSFKSMRSSTSLISVSYRIAWMRLNPTLSPTQLTRLNPHCQKYSRGSSSAGSFRDRRGRLSYPCSPEVPSRRRNCFACGEVCYWRSECSQIVRSDS